MCPLAAIVLLRRGRIRAVVTVALVSPAIPTCLRLIQASPYRHTRLWVAMPVVVLVPVWLLSAPMLVAIASDAWLGRREQRHSSDQIQSPGSSSRRFRGLVAL